MRIAQHSVAGEAVSRPQTSKASPTVEDQQALDEYACDRSNLPWVIFRAAHRATHTAALPARARALLAALARTVDATRPYAPIFARRELLTGRAQQSMRTFYRGLDDLEVAGLITRPPQTRYGQAGLFGRAYLHLTPKAATLLGLVEPESEAKKPSPAHREDASKTEAAISYACPSVTVADGAIYKDLIPTTQKRQPGRLPADLERLLPLGFREFLIFKLMREAKLHGKLLSDVVEAAWNPLSRAKHPISYLRTLLRAPVDFAYRIRTQRDARAEEVQNRLRSQRADDVIAKYAGQVFVSHDGLRRYRISDDLRSITIRHRDEPQPRVHAGTWAQDFVAALDAGRIVPGDTDSASNAFTHDDINGQTRPPEPSGAAARTTSARGRVEAHLSDLKHILRLKRAGVVPTMKPRDADTRPGQNPADSFRLSSLLKALSSAASTPS
ncbi:hypothetical protein AWB75_02381 [Caballeronia catudaia]|uniref:Replication protein O n=1 Tax=Caballeronia catudaia TaxID=1777136 RepID=A0A158AL29_9BURK|nr:replication protein O [Caballeronia catudaia]SAK58651.1 hypothetical protein AWB75_02381 [Caballeronia catudaia]